MGSFVSFAVGRVQAYLYATCIVWYASSALAQSAHSTEPAGYRALIGEALAEYDRGNSAEARALFMRAHAVNPSARTLRGLGLASFELRDYRAAIEYLDQSLASTVNPLGGTLRESTQVLLDKAHGFVGRFRLKLDPPSACLRIDGALVPVAPVMVLEVGTHELIVEAPGYLSAHHTVRVTGGEDALLDFALVMPTIGRMDLDEPAVHGAPARALARDVERPTQRPLYKNGWLWTGVGVAMAAVGVAVGMVVRRDTRTEVGELTLTQATPNGGVFSASEVRQ